MKIIKRFFYIIFGILLIGAISLTGIMLYAEYSGRRFHPGSLEEITGGAEEDSRLAYDDAGNIIELPGNSQPSSSEAGPAPASNIDTGSFPETPTENIMGTDVSNAGEPAAPASDTGNPSGTDNSAAEPAETSADTTPAADTAPDSDTEQLYIMDLETALFHTADCSDAAEIPVDKRSERTALRDKILDAGYQPCPHCNP